MKKNQFIYIATTLLSISSFSTTLWSAQGEVAGKAVIVKGKVTSQLTNGKTITLKEGSDVHEGDVITSDNSGIAKIVLKDMSEMTLSANSKFKIDDFEPQKTSVFSLMMGNLRSKISKSSDGTTKVLLKTQSATMGVRGTDFEAIVNPQTQLTSVLTYEGAVAVAKNETSNQSSTGPTTANEIASPSVADMLRAVENPNKSALTTQGQYAGITPTQELPSVPVRISPAQLETMRTSTALESGLATLPASGVGQKQTLSLVPPGIDSKMVISSVQDTQEMISKTVGTSADYSLTSTPGTGGAAPTPGSASTAYTPTIAPPEGFYDANTGRVAPPAGGFVDMNTGLYIPPPPGSSFDPIAQVYTPCASMGSFDLKNGDYVPPTGYTLDSARGLVTVATATPTATDGTQVGAIPGTAPGGAATNAHMPAMTAPTGGAAMMFPGMMVESFGAGMIAAPPPPGIDISTYGTMPGFMPPPASVILTAPAPGMGGAGYMISPTGTYAIAAPGGVYDPVSGAMISPDGLVTYDPNAIQPLFPTYNPYLCPPYCDPYNQQTAPPPTGTTSTTGATTTSVTFTIN